MSLIFLVSSYLGIFILLAMLTSVLPGMAKGEILIDKDTVIRFFVLFLALLILGYIFVLSMDNKGNNIFLKINKYISGFVYVFFIFFILFRRINDFYPRINIIPFKSIVNYPYDFITMTDELSYFSFFKFIILPIVYLIPIFILILKKNSKNYLKVTFIIIVLLEVIKFLLYKNFNVDNILFGILSSILTFEIFQKFCFNSNNAISMFF